ncbi:MAG: stage II sporulation protein D [Clostridiales bacterium]|nr:stage II sporulation protein D [Clostridiales bacterium]
MRPTTRGIAVVAIGLLLITSLIANLISAKPDEGGVGGPQATVNPDKDPKKIIIESNKDEKNISMYNHREKKLVVMSLEEYLLGVVAGEMPASYNEEALKAQAVAARTLTIYKMPAYGGRGCNQVSGADVCSSFAHCQEWISEDQMRKNWGDQYEDYVGKLRRVIQETSGQIMTYNGKPIEVFYHSTSNGRTEEVSEVFSNALPYYTSVESVGEENAPKFEGSVSISNQQFADKFNSKYGIKLDPNNLSSQIKINGYTDSGRIQDISVGGKKLRATDFRLLYGLNSTDISFVFGKDSITMNTKGFGHGVGMSQVGADRMADRGNNYTEILKHYYKGVEISKY